MLEVKSADAVFQIMKTQFSGEILSVEEILPKDALGRILAEEITASENIPGFDRSTVDGYAVISSDTFGAGESMPAQLKLAGEVHMGEKPSFSLKKGESAYIPTGGELPQNADSVVMMEYAEEYGDGYVYLEKPAAPGTHVIFKGDDTREGDVVIPAGRVLRPQEIGALAAMGIMKIKVQRKLKIAVISTGDEIVEPDQDLTSGAKVRDINSHSLYAGILACGCEPVLCGIVKDRYDLLMEAVKKAMTECDIVLISGGSSVGTRDVTCRVIEDAGSPGVLVHGIAVKPGKPTIIGKAGRKALIGLPGHPVSAYMIFRIFVVKLIQVMQNRPFSPEPFLEAVLSCNYPSNNGREEFLPVTVRAGDKDEDEDGGHSHTATPVFSKSGLITGLVRADGYVHIPRGQEGLSQGETVRVTLF